MEKRICTLCGKSYESKTESRKHYACAAEGNKRLHCCLCYRGFRTVARLELHKVAHSKSGEFIPCFHCKYCDRYMHDLQHFRRHVQRHEKKYKRFWIERPLNVGIARDSTRQPVYMKAPFRYDLLVNGTNASSTSNMFVSHGLSQKWRNAHLLSSPSNVLSGPSNVLSSPSSVVSGHCNVLSSPSNAVSGHSNVLSTPSNAVSGHSNVLPNPSNVLSGPSNTLSGHSNVLLSSPSNVLSRDSNVVPSQSNILLTPANISPIDVLIHVPDSS